MYADSSSQTSPAKYHRRQGTLRASEGRTLVFVHVQVIIVIIFELIIVLKCLF